MRATAYFFGQDMQVKIDQIKIDVRVRKDMGDIESLAESIKELGQLQPIGIDSNYRLLFGERRIRAMQQLGRDAVNAEIHSSLNTATKALQAELHENTEHKPFLPTEAVAAAEKLREMVAVEAKERQGTRTDLPEHSGNFPQSNTGKTRDKVGQAVGMSGKTYEKARQVVKAAEQSPEDYGELPALMDEQSVDAAHKQYSRKAKEKKRQAKRDANKEKIESAQSLEDLQGVFTTIVIDPPWDWGDEGDHDQKGRAKPDYQTESFENLLARPVGEKAAKDAHIYLWITNRSLPKGFDLLKAWGFRYVTALTWVKPHFGMGNYFRGQTEHVLFGVKGSLALKRKDQGTVFFADRGGSGHSSKPEEFYDLVESCSPGPYLDIFSRIERSGWTHWGEDA